MARKVLANTGDSIDLQPTCDNGINSVVYEPVLNGTYGASEAIQSGLTVEVLPADTCGNGLQNRVKNVTTEIPSPGTGAMQSAWKSPCVRLFVYRPTPFPNGCMKPCLRPIRMTSIRPPQARSLSLMERM